MSHESISSSIESEKNVIALQHENLTLEKDPRKEKTMSGVRKWLGMTFLSMGSLAAIGCDEKPAVTPASHETPHAQVEHEDRFDRAIRKVDEKFEKLAQEKETVKQLAQEQGLTIEEGQEIHYRKVHGKIVQITVGNKTIAVSEKEGETLQPEFKHPTHESIPSEIKTNPDIKDF